MCQYKQHPKIMQANAYNGKKPHVNTKLIVDGIKLWLLILLYNKLFLKFNETWLTLVTLTTKTSPALKARITKHRLHLSPFCCTVLLPGNRSPRQALNNVSAHSLALFRNCEMTRHGFQHLSGVMATRLCTVKWVHAHHTLHTTLHVMFHQSYYLLRKETCPQQWGIIKDE